MALNLNNSLICHCELNLKGFSIGMKDGQKITFHGEGDQEPGLEPGDVIIVLDQKEHEVFQRQDDNLITKIEIKLVEALCGFRKIITTLDKRTLIISTLPGELECRDKFCFF